jgi:hypothetical protein
LLAGDGEDFRSQALLLRKANLAPLLCRQRSRQRYARHYVNTNNLTDAHKRSVADGRSCGRSVFCIVRK